MTDRDLEAHFRPPTFHEEREARWTVNGKPTSSRWYPEAIVDRGIAEELAADEPMVVGKQVRTRLVSEWQVVDPVPEVASEHDPYACTSIKCERCWEFHLSQGALSDLTPEQQALAAELAGAADEPEPTPDVQA